MRPIKKLVLLLATLSLVAAACGSDSGTDETEATQATTQATTAATQAETTTTTAGTTTTIGEAADVIATDIGVTDTEIHIGILADLTGVFAGLTVDIVDAQLAYWDIVNANGGIAGRTVVPHVEDTVYMVDLHEEKYLEIVDEVVAFSNSTGSPHTAGILDNLAEDNVLAIPLSWYSGWADADFDGGLTFEQGTNYCLEGMNVVEWLTGMSAEPPTIAIVTRPGDYGEDSAAGALYAANQLGLDVVYNGIGDIVRDSAGNFDPTSIVANILSPPDGDAPPDWVFFTGSPSETAPVLGGVASQGVFPNWTGAGPSYDFRLLDSAVAELLAGFFYHTNYYVPWGTDVPGMQEIQSALTDAYPDRRPSDAFIIGWTEARQMEQILLHAAANGDMTRQGVIDAANSIEVISLDGAGPDLNYRGDPNDFVIRETSIFKPNLERYLGAGGADQTLATAPDGGTTGSDVVAANYTGDLAANFQFDGACWTQEEGDRING